MIFISYTQCDQGWAEWIAWQLREAGETVALQAWHFRPGSNFVSDIQQALEKAEYVVAVLSPEYLTSEWAEREWTASIDRLVPVRVRACQPPGLLKRLVYIDLVGCDQMAARQALQNGIHRPAAIPTSAPTFPGGGAAPFFPPDGPAIWNVPFPRNRNFTGREQFLSRLRQTFISARGSQYAQAISGLGGAGKTQLAIEYAYRFAERYSVIWWMRCEEDALLAADYTALGTRLGLVESESRRLMEAVREWLRVNEGWLLVFDNADSHETVGGLLPQLPTGHVLITSRNPDWQDVAAALPLPALEREEAVTLLRKYIGEDDPDATERLANALGDLPLAVSQAGAYMRQTKRSPAGYLSLFEQRRRELLSLGAQLNYPATIATTWELAFQMLERESPSGADLLSLCAFLDQEDFPLEKLREAAAQMPEGLKELVADPLALDSAVAALRHYSLAEVTGSVLNIHRLVLAMTRERQDETKRQAWQLVAFDIASARLPSSGGLEMASILFIDLVGFSLLQIEVQFRLIGHLQAVVREAPAWRKAEAGGHTLSLPTGDGVALVFFYGPVAAADCALEIARTASRNENLHLRMGIHTGPVYRVADVNGNLNVVGSGINFAQRVMDFGDAGHILMSRNVAEVLQQLQGWNESLHDLGLHEVKHGIKIHVYNLCKDGLGNPELPRKVSSGRVPKAAPRIRRSLIGWLNNNISRFYADSILHLPNL